MVNKRLRKAGSLLMASALLLCGRTAAAEEKRLGDYIYVPAMTASAASGTISLRVEGLALEDGETVTVNSLAGAEFGVYVIASDGELTPWANPLYPSEPMRIRTGEEAVSFSLPQGQEFYLMQESAPAGYEYEAGTLIPVTGQEIVVQNAMTGEIVVYAVDSLGTALAGVQMTIAAQDGSELVCVTDKNGQAVFSSRESGVYTVRESGLPEGVYAALSATVDGIQADLAAVNASMEAAARTSVVFEHPASGTVQLSMQLAEIDEHGEAFSRPLAGVRMDIESETPVSVVTDEEGQARAALLEGTYFVRFAYEGEESIKLPLTEGQMIVESGASTMIELTAMQAYGRVVLAAQAQKDIRGGSVTLHSEQTGETYGPYAIDGDGLAVSELLAPGKYTISAFEAPADTQLGTVSWDGQISEQTDGLMIEVQAGQAAQVSAQLLTRERQTFEVVARRLDDQGEFATEQMDEPLELELLDEHGDVLAQIGAESGLVQVEALSGTYTLRMTQKEADRLAVLGQSEPFTLPAAQGVISFACNQARIAVSAVDENGMPVSGAVYSVTDSRGEHVTLVCDEDGNAVSPLMAAGEVIIETMTSPQNHDKAQETVVSAKAGEAARVQLTHESYGAVRMAVRMKRLDERGNAVYEQVAGANVHLYRVFEDRMTDTGLIYTSGEDGQIVAQLEAGEYVAQIEAESLDDGCRTGESLRFIVTNTESTEGELVCMDALGGVQVKILGGALSDELLAQIRFEVEAADGTVTELTMQDGAFYAGQLAAGSYMLRQTQIPEGFTLAQERTVTITGAEAAAVQVPLEEYAVLSVSKTGLTFNDRLQTFIVPLTGEYGVYTMADGQMKAYPSEDKQMTVWSNVTPEQIAQGKTAALKLPAALEGTTYYLHELGSAEGFAADAAYHEVTLTAGEQRLVDCAVSSDRGFFEFTQINAANGDLVLGGTYELVSRNSGETVLTFTTGETPYRNEMAVPVGEYTLRQIQAAEGYALSAEDEISFDVQPYLTQGGQIAQVSMSCVQVPKQAEMNTIADLYAAREQGLTLVSVDTAALDAGDTLTMPQVTVQVKADGGERVNVASVVLGSASDALGSAYRARVEYCLAGGGWQPSDARITDVLSGPTAVSLADVEDDVSAVRVTYLDAQTGEEKVQSGFAPGEIALNVRVGAQGTVALHASAEMTGKFIYQTQANGAEIQMQRSSSRKIAFEVEGDGIFNTVSAGRDGRISGVAFFDTDADGVMDADETGRYAGMTVSLIAQNGDVLDSCRTDSEGRYVFSTISGGMYTVKFDAGTSVVYSKGAPYSEHKVSGVEDTRYGESARIVIDGDHTDYVVNAGCIYAAELAGVVTELDADGQSIGYIGLKIEMRAIGADEDEEPVVVTTDDRGQFAFSGILPGAYKVSVAIPEGYLCKDAQDGYIVKNVDLAQGDSIVFDEINMERSAEISGYVRIDDDGDGTLVEGAQALGGVKVVLLRIEDGHTAQTAQTTTDENGRYAFEELYAGTYSVLFELDGEWTFTRYSADSCVYGAVSQSGSSKAITLMPGDEAENVNAGVTLPAQLAVTVFKDTQFDGQKGVYEEGLEGVSLSLIRMEDGEKAEDITAKTDKEGNVVFAGVSPGEYIIAYQMPGLWRSTVQVDGKTTQYPVSCVERSTLSTGESEPFMLTMGQSGVHLYIGAMLSGSISGTVYYDDDANAQLGESEEFCEGVWVELLDAQDNVIGDQITGQDGSYAFEGLAPGRYRVRFTAQEGCGFSATERSVARGGVQESDTNISVTKAISVTAGSATESADAGVVRLGTVGGVIWEDRDADGVFSEEESVLSGVSVHLMNGAGRIIHQSITTDESGRFTFENLRPGEYKLRIDAPDTYVFSGAMSGSALPLESQRDERGYSASFTLLGGVQADNIGYGLLTQGTISGRVWLDSDYSGTMDDAESGLRGMTVALQNAGGETVASTQTLRTGEFEFDSLMPGEYTLVATLGEGYAFTAEGGDSAAPHDAAGEARISLGELTMGGTISGVNVGVLKPAAVGGVAWMDSDNDGRRQNGDAGVQGVHVTLTVVGGTDNGLVYETTTAEDGSYHFSGVMPGQIELAFELEEGNAFAKKANGTKRVSIVPQANSLRAQSDVLEIVSETDRLDLDVGVVGVGVITGTVWEDTQYDGRRGNDEQGVYGALVTLVDAASGEAVFTAESDENGEYAIDFVRVGEYRIEVELPDQMIFTMDGDSAVEMSDTSDGTTDRFTLAMGESVSGLDVGAILPAEISGLLLIDENANGDCDTGETGLEDGVITLMRGGTAVATAKTDENGAFMLDMLRPGTYRVRVTLPQNALFAHGASLRLENADAQEGETGEIELTMGDQTAIESIPAVLGAEISGYAWSDQNADGSMDKTEPALDDVVAELLAGGEVVARCEVDSDGAYAFTLLRSGEYAVRFTLPDGMLLADQTGEKGGSSAAVVPGNVGVTPLFALSMGQKIENVNIGGILPGRIGDSVWLDQNGNGLQDYQEPLIAGVSITLLSVAGDGQRTEVISTVSDEFGYYRFDDLRPGDYILRVNVREGDALTECFGAPLTEIDSDANSETGETETIHLESGQTLRNVDFGFTDYAE